MEKEKELKTTLNAEEFKLKNPVEMVEAILSDIDSVTDQVWGILLDKLSANGENPKAVRDAFYKLYDDLDIILDLQLPDRVILTLYSNATNIFKNYQQWQEKIAQKNPEIIEKTFNM